jgi:hypothetical protein
VRMSNLPTIRGMRVYIPTYRRVNIQRTWASLSPNVRNCTTLVCVADEAKALHRATGARTLVQPARVQTISTKRQWIVDQSEEPYLCMLDDDLRFAVRDPIWGQGKANADEVRLLACSNKDVDRLFKELREQLNTYAHAGISMRMANRGMHPGWHSCKRMVYVLAYETETLRRFARFDAIAHREDMWVTLKLLEHGFANSVSFEFSADQVYGSKGGETAAGRNMKESNKDAERLAKAFPGLVKVQSKQYQVGINRLEVQVQWKQAWAQHLS